MVASCSSDRAHRSIAPKAHLVHSWNNHQSDGQMVIVGNDHSRSRNSRNGIGDGQRYGDGDGGDGDERDELLELR